MNNRIYVLLSFALVVMIALFGCQQESHFDVTAMKKIIEEKNNQFTNAHIIGDSIAMVDIYTQGKYFHPIPML